MRTRMAFIGDSVVRGTGASSPQSAWVYSVADSLGVAADGFVVSASGGATSRDLSRLLGDLDGLIGAGPPPIVCAGVGVNDSRWRASLASHEVSAGAYGQNVADFVEELQARRSTEVVCLVGQFPVIDEVVNPYKPDKAYYRRDQFEYERALADVARARAVCFVPILERALGEGEGFVRSASLDGLHPNDLGHGLIRDAVVAALADAGEAEL